MKELNSVVLGCDGESKCGKTTIITTINQEAAYQAETIPASMINFLSRSNGGLSEEQSRKIYDDHARVSFRGIYPISAGNTFRGAALYAIQQERQGKRLTGFSKDDEPYLRALLASEGVTEILQEDPEVEARVSHVAKMAGVQALCGAIFCEEIVNAYYADGGANLVIVDARNPVGCMQRNNSIGTGDRQIHPASIIPIYIDTPVEVAARRMGGTFSEKLAMITERRHADATRPELPVIRPPDLMYDSSEWCRQFSAPGMEVARPLHVDNGERVTLENIQYFAGQMASFAHDVAWTVHNFGKAISPTV